MSVVELPRRRRRRARGWIAAGVGLVLLGGLLAVLYLTPALAVRQVEIKGTRLASDSSVHSLLEPLVGTPMARVTTDRVRALLKEEPAIQDVRLGLDGPTGLVVTVLEHREVAILQQGDRYALVGDNGVTLKALSKRSDRRLPVVKLSVPDPDGRIFDTVVQSLSQLPPAVLAKLDTAGAESVDAVTFTLTDHRKVVWGDASQGGLKAKVLAAMLADASLKDKVLDVSTPNTPLTSG